MAAKTQINIRVNETQLAEIDAIAAATGQTRTSYILSATMRQIATDKHTGIAAMNDTTHDEAVGRIAGEIDPNGTLKGMSLQSAMESIADQLAVFGEEMSYTEDEVAAYLSWLEL